MNQVIAVVVCWRDRCVPGREGVVIELHPDTSRSALGVAVGVVSPLFPLSRSRTLDEYLLLESPSESGAPAARDSSGSRQSPSSESRQRHWRLPRESLADSASGPGQTERRTQCGPCSETLPKTET
jgi:hypothetical protein